MRVAIVGAGIAGPTLAWWLERGGHEPTLIEQAPGFRTGGYVVDFWGVGYTVAERMGLLAGGGDFLLAVEHMLRASRQQGILARHHQFDGVDAVVGTLANEGAHALAHIFGGKEQKEVLALVSQALDTLAPASTVPTSTPDTTPATTAPPSGS